jgi:hypothetical protein
VDWQPTIKLSTEQMIEPMAAPIGYSVQPAQGTGLGPAALTGIQNSDEEIGYQKADHNSIPPPAPRFGHGSNGGGFGDGGNGGGGNISVVSATPYTPKSNDSLPTTTAYVHGGASTTSSVTQPTQMNGTSAAESGVYDEVDIFVPTIPTAPPGGSSPMNNGGKKSHDDEDDHNPSATSGGASPSAGTSTYEDLAARFQQLNK